MMRKALTGMMLTGLLWAVPAQAWNDRTHMAVVEAAGAPALAYMAVGADMAKEKFPDERYNHYSGNRRDAVITVRDVLDQSALYNTGQPAAGHLYGAVVAAVDRYRELRKDPSKYALYPLGYAMHYIGDLSMPYHNVGNPDGFQANHGRNDGVVEGERDLVREIRSRMGRHAVIIDRRQFRESLAARVAELATVTTSLGYRLADSRTPLMSRETAFDQLSRSAALLRGVLIALELPVAEYP